MWGSDVGVASVRTEYSLPAPMHRRRGGIGNAGRSMNEKLDDATIGVRAQELHEGLRDVAAFGPKEVHLQPTLRIGKAASLATHLKGLDYVESWEALGYLAAELGIGGGELRLVLRELEEVGFATVVEPGGRFRRLELAIPELRDGYHDLGARWQQLGPGEIETATLVALERVATVPQPEAALRRDLGLDTAAFDTILALGTAGMVLARHGADPETAVLYSPLTVEERPDALLALTARFPEARVVRALESVRRQQGVPLGMLRTDDPSVVREAIALGVLCPVRIAHGGADQAFLFSPYGQLRPEERVILEKARALLACVRFGEHYAAVRPIQYPQRILETLRDRKTFRYPRPDVPEQYGLLVRQQIGTIAPDRARSGFYHFHLHDTPENRRALTIAIDLLNLGQVPRSRLDVDASTLLGVGGSFSGTLPTRARLARGVSLSLEASRDLLGTLSKLARGAL